MSSKNSNTNGNYLSKKSILQADDLTTADVYVEEWDGTVRVAEMGADARDEFEQYLADASRKSKDEKQKYFAIRAPLCAMCIVDDKGNRIFSFDDVEKLGKKNGQALDKIFDKANELNKIFGSAREDVAKNSETAQAENDGGE